MKNLEIKAVFVLASNHFRKSFSINAGVLLRMENGFSGKEFQLIVKLRPLTWKIFSAKILPSNHFLRCAKRERERERTHTRKQREREIANPKKWRSSHHRRDRQPEIVEPTNSELHEPTNHERQTTNGEPTSHERQTHKPTNSEPTNSEPMNPRSNRELTNNESHHTNHTGESHRYRSRSRSRYQRVAPLPISFL